MSDRPARVALVGAHGFGAVHRRNLAGLEELGRTTLVAVADPAPPAPGELGRNVRVYPGLGELLAGEDALDVVIVSTPIHTHFELAVQALASGADLYLEKPPVTSLAQLARLQTAAERAGRLVQVGFQSLGSHAIPWLRAAVDDGVLGEVRAVTAVGSWTRDRAYFSRSPWAGKRRIGDIDVVDGVATNALSHAVITAMTVAGVRRADQIASLDLDLHRANTTESDDTSVVRVRRAGDGPDITCALTLCGPREAEPYVTLHGSEASATFFYVLDEVRVDARDGARTERFGRTDLLENLLDARAGDAELLCALADTEAYMSVLEGVRTAPAPREIPPEWVERVGSGPQEHLVVRGIDEALTRAVAAEATFSELGIPWAVESDVEAEDVDADAGVDDDAEVGADAGIRVGGRVVAVRRSGDALGASLSPRPYLHPVRTLGGTTLTDHLPLDHPWHLGVGVAVPDVTVRVALPDVTAPDVAVPGVTAPGRRVNFWGGPDYDGDTGEYRWGGAHGMIRTESLSAQAGSLREELAWRDRGGSVLLRERREWRPDALDDTTWRLAARFELRAMQPVSLGSPGSHGRPGAGYGGFFWRFAPCDDVEVETPESSGADALNGARAPWLLWRASFGGRPASVVLVAPPEADDPWFVRADEYPGVGSALAWAEPVELAAGASLVRTVVAFVSDGHLAASDAARLASG